MWIRDRKGTEHTWRSELLEDSRMRSVLFRLGWAHVRRQGHYRDFHVAFAKLARADFPDAKAFRTRLYTYTTQSPTEIQSGIAATGTFHQPLITRF